MTTRFEKFNDQARSVLKLSQEAACQLSHNYIGTEHIMLGLVGETKGVAAQVLASMEVDLTKIRSAVEFIIGRGDKLVYGGGLELTPRAKKVIELGIDEARRMNHTYIGTEHLLIGLLREGEGVAAGVLESLGVTIEKVRNETHRVLSGRAKDIVLKQEPESPFAVAFEALMDVQRRLAHTDQALARAEADLVKAQAYVEEVTRRRDDLKEKRIVAVEDLQNAAAALAATKP